jgi:sporulation protein YtfJ
MDSNHPIDSLMKNTMENLKEMIDVNTIVGDAVESKDGSLIIPISKVSFGFASGGSEFSSKGGSSNNNGKYPFGGGSGSGVSVKPVAFLVLNNDGVRLLSIDAETTYDKIVDSVPQVLDMIKSFFKKDNSNCSSSNTNQNVNQNTNQNTNQSACQNANMNTNGTKE